ncbi:hypothetical protein GCM10010498_50590 [Streptomyces cavourensis]|nr:hypothetical protein GCM10010498_50590 [Streptomyces cavourensis]
MSVRAPGSAGKAQINHDVPVHRTPVPVTYFECAPHPPSERWTDAGQLPPWLPGVAVSPTGDASFTVCSG